MARIGRHRDIGRMSIGSSPRWIMCKFIVRIMLWVERKFFLCSVCSRLS